MRLWADRTVVARGSQGAVWVRSANPAFTATLGNTTTVDDRQISLGKDGKFEQCIWLQRSLTSCGMFLTENGR